MAKDKIYIEKNTVQETLIAPLYGRKICTEKFPDLYSDKYAKDFCNRLDYDFSKLDKKKDSIFYEFGGLEAAMRQIAMRWEIDDYFKIYPKASVVNIGCGLDQTGRTVDNGKCKIYNIDFPNIIEIREELLETGDREYNIASDIKDEGWMDEIDKDNGVIIFAAGVFHYLSTDEVRDLVLKMIDRFPKGRLIFDTIGKNGLFLMKRTLKNLGIGDIKGQFHLDDLELLMNWSNKIEVSQKGYMLGYYDLKEYNIPWTLRFLAKMGEKIFGMKIIRMEFVD